MYRGSSKSPRPPQSQERALFFKEVTLPVSEERKKIDLSGQAGPPVFEELWFMCTADIHYPLGRERGGQNTQRGFYI